MDHLIKSFEALTGTQDTGLLNLVIKFNYRNYMTAVVWCVPAHMFVCGYRDESVHPYCERVKDGGLQTECTQQRDAMALCNLIDYGKSLPAQYQVTVRRT